MSAMYLQNKYTNWYFNIVNNAKLKQKTGYTEKHHIIPKSLGGDNSKLNLVELTAREHFVCHLLLTRMTSGLAKKKMVLAVFYLLGSGKGNRSNKIKSSHSYSILKEELSKIVSTQHKGRKRPIRSKNYKEKQKISHQGHKNHKFIGRYITPWGLYESSREAAQRCPQYITANYVIRLCKLKNDCVISNLSVCRSKEYLTNDHIGLTPKQLGFGFIPK